MCLFSLLVFERRSHVVQAGLRLDPPASES